jgi:hypothetical protein
LESGKDTKKLTKIFMDIFNVKAIFKKIPKEAGVKSYTQVYYLFKGLKQQLTPENIDAVIKVLKDETKQAENLLINLKKEIIKESEAEA